MAASSSESRVYEYNLAIRFQAQVEQSPEQAAIRFDAHHAIGYDELNRSANRLARRLLSLGVGAGDVVCLSGEKSLGTFASMIACLKIGAAYAVLDPDSPVERLRKIVATCRPSLVLAGPEFAELTPSLDARVVAKDDDASGPHDDSNLAETRGITGSNPAYVMFTSGSTGFPKGAVMTHAAVLNLIAWSRSTFAIEPADRLTNVNPLYFDNSVFDFYASLFNGASLVPFSGDEVRDPKLLVEKVAATACTLWFSVPSLLIFLQTMKAASGDNLRSIRRFVFGGEGYPKAKLKELYDVYSSTSELFNVYGPTECTCICSSYRISARDFEDLRGLPPLGTLAENFSFLVLDDDGRIVPTGETGELSLLGPNVGKGYYNDPVRTEASFVRNPYNEAFDEVMYKTGDLVRVDPADGMLHIQGRKDNQIKHMGYRIELEEIEAALNCLDYVSEAAALHASVNGLSRIVAVVATREQLEEARIRRDVAQIIPSYMVPSTFHREPVLPKNASGKVDRRLLTAKYLQPSDP